MSQHIKILEKEIKKELKTIRKQSEKNKQRVKPGVINIIFI